MKDSSPIASPVSEPEIAGYRDHAKQLGQDLDTASTWAANAIPAERRGTPQDIAENDVFPASDRASFVTGQTILVDGGYTHTPY